MISWLNSFVLIACCIVDNTGKINRSGKNTNFSMISNSVTYLQSYTNTTIAGNFTWVPKFPRRVPMLPHQAPISLHRMESLRVFHDVSQCFKSVSCFTSDSFWCFMCVSPSVQSMLNMRRSLANFYTYWRSWRPILGDFMPSEDLGDHFLLSLCLLKILETCIWQEAFHGSVCLFLLV